MSEERYKVAVLMGGLGTRLKDADSKAPKCMVPVCGKPFFQWQLELMRWYGFTRFIFCVGHQADAVRDYYKDGSQSGVSIEYSEDGPALLGTGGALKKASKFLTDDFIVIYGDSYMDVDYLELVYRYGLVKEAASGMMVVYQNDDQLDRSNVVMSGGKILRYGKGQNDPAMNYIDYGVCVLNQKVLAALPPGISQDLADCYSGLVQEGRLAAFETDRRFYEIGNPKSYAEFQRFAKQSLSQKKRAVFFDRDGTLNRMMEERPMGLSDSPMNPDQMELYPEAVEVLQKIQKAGYRVIVITNQPAAAKARTTLGVLYDVNRRFRKLLSSEAIDLDALMMCPHHPTGSPQAHEQYLIGACECRKPKPGMIHKAMQLYPTQTEGSLFVGDSRKDVEASKAAGIRCAFLERAGRSHAENVDDLEPEFRIKDLKGVLEILQPA